MRRTSSSSLFMSRGNFGTKGNFLFLLWWWWPQTVGDGGRVKERERLSRLSHDFQSIRRRRSQIDLLADFGVCSLFRSLSLSLSHLTWSIYLLLMPLLIITTTTTNGERELIYFLTFSSFPGSSPPSPFLLFNLTFFARIFRFLGFTVRQSLLQPLQLSILTAH